MNLKTHNILSLDLLQHFDHYTVYFFLEDVIMHILSSSSILETPNMSSFSLDCSSTKTLPPKLNAVFDATVDT